MKKYLVESNIVIIAKSIIYTDESCKYKARKKIENTLYSIIQDNRLQNYIDLDVKIVSKVKKNKKI